MLNRGKIDQEYPLFMLYNKSNIPGRPESIGVQTKRFSDLPRNFKSNVKYNKVLKSLLEGCRSLEKSGCKFIVIPCNTAHYWYEDLKKKIKIPIINMPKEVFLHTKKICKKNSKIGLLATEGTLKTKGKVIIGVDGFIKGTIEATNAEIEGKFSGELSIANILTIKAAANISGDIVVGKLSIEPGATFNASCLMKGALKELNKSNETKQASEKTA